MLAGGLIAAVNDLLCLLNHIYLFIWWSSLDQFLERPQVLSEGLLVMMNLRSWTTLSLWQSCCSTSFPFSTLLCSRAAFSFSKLKLNISLFFSENCCISASRRSVLSRFWLGSWAIPKSLLTHSRVLQSSAETHLERSSYRLSQS